MTTTYNFLLSFLEKEKISIDESNFFLQFYSHPEFPSILSISDTLDYFNIINGAINIPFSEIDSVPNRFLGLLKVKNETSQLYFIEEKNGVYLCKNDNLIKNVLKSDLQLIWDNVIILVEKPENTSLLKKPNYISFTLCVFCCVFFLTTLFLFEEKTIYKLFFIFPFFGFILSLYALKDLIGFKSGFLKKICNFSEETDCNFNSSISKWSIFKFLNFSDLSIIHFSSQIVVFFTFLIGDIISEFFIIQKIILILSIPLLSLSIYYQKIIQKKWCPICLLIISITIIEIIFIFFFTPKGIDVCLNSTLLFCFLFLLLAILWIKLKKLLFKLKQLKEFQIQGIRLMRNFKIFKTTLILNEKHNSIYSNPIILGNNESKTEITFITNPFCKYCQKNHEILKQILNKNNQNTKVNLILKRNFANENEEERVLINSLFQTYLNLGQEKFIDAFNFWFDNNDFNKWIKKHEIKIDLNYVTSISNDQNNWCLENKLSHTPIILINGYKYPDSHPIETLPFLMNDIILNDF